MKGIWREQIGRHPSIEPQDVVKLCYQNAFGAEHLLEDMEAAKGYFLREFNQVQSKREEPLQEDIGSGFYRVNLGVWKERGLPPEWLFRMFAETAARPQDGGKSRFEACIREAEELVAEGAFGFGREAWKEFMQGYPLTEPVPVHHSEGYRRAEKPAYRLISQDYIDLYPLLDAIHSRQQARDKLESGNIVVAMDGPCASGKTTLAGRLSAVTGAGIVHMDDFFLPADLRTEERFREPGGNVHYERFQEEVIPALARGGEFSYRSFDCRKMALGEMRQVSGNGIVIVEGSYSCHPKLGEYMAVRVFCCVELEEQLVRIERRDGEDAARSFRQRWIPLEEAYFEAYDLQKKADILM